MPQDLPARKLRIVPPTVGTSPLPAPAAPGTEGPDGRQTAPEERDADRRTILLFALGGMDNAIENQVLSVMKQVLVVAMHLNPLVVGMVLSLKTLWDAIAVPLMAWLSDNTRSRWGRRRPYILVGGLLSLAALLALFTMLPRGPGRISSNLELEAHKRSGEALTTARSASDALRRALSDGVWDAATRDQVQAQRATARELLITYRPVVEASVAEQRTQVERLRSAAAESDDAAHAVQPALRDAKLLHQGYHEQLRRLDQAAEHLAAHETALAALAVGNGTAEGPTRAQALAELGRLPATALPPPPAPPANAGPWDNFREAWRSFLSPANADQRDTVLFVLLGLVVYASFQTMNAVPYHALSIELCASYDGRTRVVMYRAIMNKVVGLVTPWVPAVCYTTLFVDALEGLAWVSVLALCLSVPATIIMVRAVRERPLPPSAAQGGPPQLGLFRSLWLTFRNPNFVRIFLLYQLVGITNGLVAMVGMYLNIYWVMGSALAGAQLAAGVGMVAWVIGLISLPILQWACRRFQKHVVLRAALGWMILGSILKWWIYVPERPELQFIMPLFFAFGISAYFMVLSTMLADVTDDDELATGQRREGMFGAAMGFSYKLVESLVPTLAGLLLLASGFEPAQEYHQSPETIHTMRVLFSLMPAAMMSFALFVLWRYPLTRERIAEIKATLRQRRAAAPETA